MLLFSAPTKGELLTEGRDVALLKLSAARIESDPCPRYPRRLDSFSRSNREQIAQNDNPKIMVSDRIHGWAYSI